MTSERLLAAEFSSLWKGLMPLSDAFTRRLKSHVERFAKPHNSPLDPERNSLSSELGFRYFEKYVAGDFTFTEIRNRGKSETGDAELDVIKYIQSIRGPNATTLAVTAEDMNDASVLARRLIAFFRSSIDTKQLSTSPQFAGCGIVEQCYGDVLDGNTLFEVKNVSRDFRAADIRQLLVYCALARAASGPEIKNIGIVNGRLGTYVKFQIDQVSMETAGVDSSELLAELIYFMSAEHSSR